MGPVFVRGQNPSRKYVSEDDLNTILLQTHFRATLPLKVGHGTKGKKEKIKQISLTTAASSLIASQPTLWPH